MLVDGRNEGAAFLKVYFFRILLKKRLLRGLTAQERPFLTPR